MSTTKLGSAPPPPPYKIPLSERIFGIGKLKPPVTEGVTAHDLLTSIKLGSFSLELDSQGQWQMDSKLEQMYRAQITQLEAKISELEDERLNKNVYELEKKNIALERDRLILQDENNQLKFKNKVLMAMCTISEGDYKSLCKEAGIEPRSQKKPSPTPVNLANTQQFQPQSSPINTNPTINPAASPANQNAGPYPSSQRGPAPGGVQAMISPGAAQTPYSQQPLQSPNSQQFNNPNSVRGQQQPAR